MTPEGKIKARVKARIATAFPYSYRFMPVQNGMGSPALDFYYCINGQFIAIETKKDTGDIFLDWDTQWAKATPRQQQTMSEIATASGHTYVVDSESSLDAAISEIASHVGYYCQEQQGPGSTSFDCGQ